MKTFTARSIPSTVPSTSTIHALISLIITSPTDSRFHRIALVFARRPRSPRVSTRPASRDRERVDSMSRHSPPRVARRRRRRVHHDQVRPRRHRRAARQGPRQPIRGGAKVAHGKVSHQRRPSRARARRGGRRSPRSRRENDDGTGRDSRQSILGHRGGGRARRIGGDRIAGGRGAEGGETVRGETGRRGRRRGVLSRLVRGRASGR